MIGGITSLPLVLLFLPIIFANISDLIIAMIMIYYTGFVRKAICSCINIFRCLKCPDCRGKLVTAIVDTRKLFTHGKNNFEISKNLARSENNFVGLSK